MKSHCQILLDLALTLQGPLSDTTSASGAGSGPGSVDLFSEVDPEEISPLVRGCKREIPEPHHKDRKLNPVWNYYKKSIKIDSTGMIKTLFVNSWLVVLFVVKEWQCLKL